MASEMLVSSSCPTVELVSSQMRRSCMQGLQKFCSNVWVLYTSCCGRLLWDMQPEIQGAVRKGNLVPCHKHLFLKVLSDMCGGTAGDDQWAV